MKKVKLIGICLAMFFCSVGFAQTAFETNIYIGIDQPFSNTFSQFFDENVQSFTPKDEEYLYAYSSNYSGNYNIRTAFLASPYMGFEIGFSLNEKISLFSGIEVILHRFEFTNNSSFNLDRVELVDTVGYNKITYFGNEPLDVTGCDDIVEFFDLKTADFENTFYGSFLVIPLKFRLKEIYKKLSIDFGLHYKILADDNFQRPQSGMIFLSEEQNLCTVVDAINAFENPTAILSFQHCFSFALLYDFYEKFGIRLGLKSNLNSFFRHGEHLVIPSALGYIKPLSINFDVYYRL